MGAMELPFGAFPMRPCGKSSPYTYSSYIHPDKRSETVSRQNSQHSPTITSRHLYPSIQHPSTTFTPKSHTPSLSLPRLSSLYIASRVIILLVLLFASPLAVSAQELLTTNATLHFTGGAPLCQTCEGGFRTDSFACNYQHRGNWSDGTRDFQDPLPLHASIQSMTITLYGSFNCDSTNPEPSIVTLTLETQLVISQATLPQNLPCYCGNCVDGYTFFINSTSSWSSYKFGDKNSFQVLVTGLNSICLSTVVLAFSYTAPIPVPTTSSATTSSSTGTTGPSPTNIPFMSWGILAACVLGGLVLIIVFFGLLKRRYHRDGYQRIGEGKEITIEEVKIGPRIGKGNFGEVYKGYWRGAEIAVKKLPAHNMTEHLLKEFHREITLMRALRHPNVIQYLGSCTVPPDICICTEYMPRGSLYRILHDPSLPLPWALVRRMAVDAARGSLYLHSSDPVIVHRDLKSHNLLVDENWKVKVCDFGLSTIVEQASHTMTACGTPCWTAPEILRNQRYTEKADVYSFGIVLWEMATREDPYAGMPPFQVIFAVGREGLRPPVPKTAPPEYVRLMTECWAENPAGRPTMREVLTRLEALDTTGWPDIDCHSTPML